MRGLRSVVLCVAVTLPAALQAQSGELRLGTRDGSRLWIEGGSSIRGWKCDATRPDVTVSGRAVDRTASARDVSAAVQRALLTIPVAALDCRNGTMNEHMRKALKANAHKTIEYRVAKWELTPRGDDEGTVTTSGTLVMAGAERPISVELSAKRGEAGTWRVAGSKTLRMTEWGIKPPTLMLGTMKVHDPVTIKFELVLEPR